MRLTQMFPKETLDAEDFAAAFPNGAVLTIESIDYKTLEARRSGEAELLYFLKTRELRKPLKLNKTNAYAIADHHGDDTDGWIGKTIRLLGVQIAVTDRSTRARKRVWTFDVDAMRPTEPPSIPPGTDITGAASQSRVLPPRHVAPLPQGGAGAAMGELTPIGEDTACDLVGALGERARALGDLVKHLDSIGLGGLVEGKLPPAWPQAVLPVARKFCSQLPKVAARMTPAAIASLRTHWQHAAAELRPEVVDTRTGEVINADASAPRSAPRAALELDPDESDIPF